VLLGIAGGFAAFFGAVAILLGLTRLLQLGGVSIAVGIPLVLLGFASELYAPFMGGVSLIILGVAVTLANIGLNARIAFTTAGFVLLVYWLLAAGNHIPPYGWSGDIELFFLSGLTMVLSGTFILVYNADLLLKLLTLTGGAFSSLVPSIKTAVAYPLANRFRTGMTIAMISLVMFALVMMSTMNENFDRIFLSDEALGGYEVAVIENPNNPIDDLPGAVTQNGGDASGIAGADRIDRSNSAISQARVTGDEEFHDFQILGITPEFAANNDVKLSGRATGYQSDEAVWQALADDPDKAVIDGFSVGGVDGGFDSSGFVVDEIDVKDEVFEPARVQIRNASSGTTRRVEVIGVIDTKATLLFSGLFVSPRAFDDVYGEPESSVHYVRLTSGADARDTAREIEKTLLRQGVQADSLRKIIEDEQALSRGFLYVIQGFMGLGLFVGIAAVGVIAFRTVVERRQQIGMLRAIGYTRGAVALSFLMESSFVTLLGIFSGVGLGLLLANQLVSTDDFVPGGVDSFYIPWVQIGVISAFAFLASLIMTIIPSRQAASIPIAEALRYE
jgi:putative ABC transport system permease protein